MAVCVLTLNILVKTAVYEKSLSFRWSFLWWNEKMKGEEGQHFTCGNISSITILQAISVTIGWIALELVTVSGLLRNSSKWRSSFCYGQQQAQHHKKPSLASNMQYICIFGYSPEDVGRSQSMWGRDHVKINTTVSETICYTKMSSRSQSHKNSFVHNGAFVNRAVICRWLAAWSICPVF